MKPVFMGEGRDLDEQFGVIVETAVLQTGNGNHGAIRGVVQTAKLVFGSFSSDQFYFFFKRSGATNVYCYQITFFLFDNANFRQIHGQQCDHILMVVAQCLFNGLQVDHATVQVGYFFFQKAFHIFSGTVFHKYLYFID